MSWTTFETPEGNEVDAWLVTDPGDTPQGTPASLGQWVIREIKDLGGEQAVAYYTMDQPPTDWTVTAVAPTGMPANSPIKLPDDPRTDLWNMTVDQLRDMALAMGVEWDPNWQPFKKKMVYAIDAARRGGLVTETVPAGDKFLGPVREMATVPPGTPVRNDPGPYRGDDPSAISSPDGG